MDLQIAHTAHLAPATLEATRAMIEDAFRGDFSAEDWEHTLGGLHVLAWEDGEPVAHAAVVQRRLFNAGRTLRTGYVEAVAVRADHRRRGHGAAVMRALDPVIRGAYHLGALAATEEGAGLYAALGWQRWRGPTAVLTPDGVRPTPGTERIYVLEVGAPLDPATALACDWRDGDPW